MLRAFFCAIGISLLILGGECFVVDKAVLAVPQSKTGSAPHFAMQQQQVPVAGGKELTPPEWAPWTLISVGAVLVLFNASAGRESEMQGACRMPA